MYGEAVAENLKKFTIFDGFLPVFQLLLLQISTQPNKIHIIYSHTLARSSCKILALSAPRELSNRPQCRPTQVKNGENRTNRQL